MLQIGGNRKERERERMKEVKFVDKGTTISETISPI
jgi:hypothetical protein